MQTPQTDQGKHDKLIEAARHAEAGEFEQAIILLKDLMHHEPRHELAIGMLGGLYAQIDLHERAIEHFRRVLQINPKNALAGFQLGLSLMTVGRPEEAIATWKLLLLNGDDFLAHFYSALVLTQMGRAAEAKPLLATAAARMPNNHAAYPQLLELLNGSSAKG